MHGRLGSSFHSSHRHKKGGDQKGYLSLNVLAFSRGFINVTKSIYLLSYIHH